jgi:hypothetical protein
MLPRTLAGASIAGWALLTVRVHDGGCGGPTLHWLLLEPLAEALALKALFQEGGTLSALVLLAPYAGLALGGLTTVMARRERSRMSRTLILAAGAGLLCASLWAALLGLYVYA